LIHARVKGTNRELVNSPFRYVNAKAIVHHANFKLDPRNFSAIFTGGGRMAFDDLRVDPTDNCNANCVYCPIWRSTARIEPGQFGAFLENRVERVERLQFGCGQEPTLHPELTEFFKIAAARKATIPYLQMVTNGMLLHKHDFAVFRETGLNRLLVSMDSPDETTTRTLRPGTSVPYITRNIEKFAKVCPDTLVAFSIVVSKPTVEQVPDLIRLGQKLGVGQFVLREVHDFSGGHPRRPDIPENIRQIRLANGRFAKMKEELLELFPKANFEFINEELFENPELNLRHRAARHSTRGFEPAELPIG
jgi:molybdenum cofactor biosynthesis enzyme MoaA